MKVIQPQNFNASDVVYETLYEDGPALNRFLYKFTIRRKYIHIFHFWNFIVSKVVDDTLLSLYSFNVKQVMSREHDHISAKEASMSSWV